MNLNHAHLGVADLRTAVEWFDRIWEVTPRFHDERIAVFAFGSFTIILDAAETDSPVTLGFESDDCDRDFHAVLRRGATPLEQPSNKPWGVRSAYLQGPGRLKFEIEGPSPSDV